MGLQAGLPLAINVLRKLAISQLSGIRAAVIIVVLQGFDVIVLQGVCVPLGLGAHRLIINVRLGIFDYLHDDRVCGEW